MSNKKEKKSATFVCLNVNANNSARTDTRKNNRLNTKRNESKNDRESLNLNNRNLFSLLLKERTVGAVTMLLGREFHIFMTGLLTSYVSADRLVFTGRMSV